MEQGDPQDTRPQECPERGTPTATEGKTGAAATATPSTSSAAPAAAVALVGGGGRMRQALSKKFNRKHNKPTEYRS